MMNSSFVGRPIQQQRINSTSPQVLSRHVINCGPHRILLLWLLAILTILLSGATTSTWAQRPNIVVIVSDDAGHNDFGFSAALNGKPTQFQTPNLDALAAASNTQVMSAGYVAAPMCSPSRAGFLTGQYPSRFGYDYNITDNNVSPQLGLQPNQQLVSEYLKDLGYTTGAIGKWHVGDAAGHNRPLDQGFDEFYGFLGGNRSFFGTPEANPVKKLMRGNSIIDNQWATQGDTSRYDPVKGRYLTDAFGEEAADFINRHSNDEEPFFLYVALTAPHTPFHAKQEDLDRFSDITNVTRRTMAAMTYGMDRAVGDITGALAANGIADETVVLVFNDNGGPSPAIGPYDNYPYRNYKGSLFEGGFRVPFMISAPGLQNGIYDRPVQTTDLIPTFINAAGGNAAEYDLDGTDLMPFLTGESTGDPNEYLHWRSADGRFAIRKGDWKLFRPDTQYIRFVNTANDPFEQVDLRNQQPGLFAEMLRELTYWEATLEKPKWGVSGSARNLFDHFVFQNDVASTSNWSTASMWTKAGTSTAVRLLNEDAYANAVLEFRTRNDASYTATNDLRRFSTQTFMLNQVRFTGEFSGASDQSATVNGLELLFVKSLAGQLPQIRVEATSNTSTHFAFQLHNELQLLDDLEITGNGTQSLIIHGNIRDFYAPRGVTKTGSSSVTLRGQNTFRGALAVLEGQLKLDSSTASVDDADSVLVHEQANLTLQDGTIRTSSLTNANIDAFDFQGGRLEVGNVVGSIANNGGTFAPNASSAPTTLSGDFIQNSGNLEIQLGGTDTGQFDQLVISGEAQLGGILNVQLTQSFIPALGSQFVILSAVGGISGGFSSAALPTLSSDKLWSIHYGDESVTLLVTLPGDFNGDGAVDASDYVLLRKNGATALQFDQWRANFGRSIEFGAGSSQVPEPSSLMLLFITAGFAAACRPRRR